jgi:hypothetical protein
MQLLAFAEDFSAVGVFAGYVFEACLSQLPNNSRRMKPSANRIQHLNPTLQQFEIHGIPFYYSSLSNALQHHGEKGTKSLGSVNRLPRRQHNKTDNTYS